MKAARYLQKMDITVCKSLQKSEIPSKSKVNFHAKNHKENLQRKIWESLHCYNLKVSYILITIYYFEKFFFHTLSNIKRRDSTT